MPNLFWLFCFLWKGPSILQALPISLSGPSEYRNPFSNWEINWLTYSIGFLGMTVTAFTLVGCLCCRRNSRPKGFKESSGSINKEFKDASTIENDSVAPQNIQGLELQVPHISFDRIQFEPLAVEHFIPEINVISSANRPKPPSASPSIFEDYENESEHSTIQDSCQEWFQNNDLHVSREKLKYLREIGHGWFGKVVEGCADFEGVRTNLKNRSVVVRILTEEATVKEKAWFLGEATPYFKLRHRNILPLFGSCLESDPYLLLFEFCPLGDLKNFLCSNRDSESQEVLIKENMPTRMAIEVGAGLRHMHEHKLAHTDLSARNCLVASDLSIKLGDYGTGVEKYPGDYYILGDRALPIRWSAPESVECTETTIETREITPKANIWSYAVLLWEILMWGERPYDKLEDEEVIKIFLTSKSGLKPIGCQLLLKDCENCGASNLIEAIRACLVLNPSDRVSLEQARHLLLKDQLETDSSDFEQRWENLKPNTVKEPVRSASLQDLRGSLDSELWASFAQTSFRLGPEEPVKNVPGNVKFSTRLPFRDSDSETEEESWRGRVERGVYTEKVRQKSKSVTDLMVLVHIEPDSDAELSLGIQLPVIDKSLKKRSPATGSDGDLPSIVLTDEFDLALKQLRDPSASGSSFRGSKKFHDSSARDWCRPTINDNKKIANQEYQESQLLSNMHKEELMLLTKSNPEQYIVLDKNEEQSNVKCNNKEIETVNNKCCFSNNSSQIAEIERNSSSASSNNNFNNNNNNIIDVTLWDHALNSALEEKNSKISAENDFNTFTCKINEIISPSPQSRGEYSGDDLDDELSNTDDLPKKHDDEEDRKRMCTPDDERSSDSGFRDKESCEEEESPLAGTLGNLMVSQSNTPKSAGHELAEEEQLKILFELDTILDAEYCKTFSNPLDINIEKVMAFQKESDPDETETIPSSSEGSGITEKERGCDNVEKNVVNLQNIQESSLCENLDNQLSNNSNFSLTTITPALELPKSVDNLSEHDNDDEDSSTVSLKSDNSYISFSMDEEFVTAIRNELKEKLPQAQMSVIEKEEPRDEEEPSIITDAANKNWDNDDDDSEDVSDRTGIIDIAIKYNIYAAPLSPILEERESATNSESIILRDNLKDSKDESTVSKTSSTDEDVLLIDTQTNKVTLWEGTVGDKSTESEELLDTCTFESTSESNLINTLTSNQSCESTIGTSSDSAAHPPSPQDEIKFNQQILQFSLPIHLQDNLMSTSFADNCDWQGSIEDTEINSDNENDNDDADNDENDEDEDDDDEDDDGDDGEIGGSIGDNDGENDDDSSSSSGEFVWKNYNTIEMERHAKQNLGMEDNLDDFNEEDDDDDEDEEDEEFTPSAWNATLAPHRSALKSPEKSTKSKEQKKSVWFKKQRYHCVYEYPKETPPAEHQSPATPSWQPTSYADWEEMIDDIDRLNFQPMDYFDTNNTTGDEEFFVSSSSRPFQLGNGKYVSQFFPGASTSSSPGESQKSLDLQEVEQPIAGGRQQLGELRHTRDKLKLNFVSANGGASGMGMLCNPSKYGKVENVDDDKQQDTTESVETKNNNLEEPQISLLDREANSVLSSAKLSPSDGSQTNFELKSDSSCDNSNNSHNIG